MHNYGRRRYIVMILKSAAELNAFREQARDSFAIKEGGMKIIVGMATCGIAAGAKPVIDVLREEASAKKLENVAVAQAGCIGLCQYEPIVEVLEPGKEKVTYVKIDAEKAKEIFDRHIVGGRIVSDYTIGAVNS